MRVVDGAEENHGDVCDGCGADIHKVDVVVVVLGWCVGAGD